MTAQEARALAMAYELHALLGQLFDQPDHGPGSGVERAWDRMDEVISDLEPLPLEPEIAAASPSDCERWASSPASC